MERRELDLLPNGGMSTSQQSLLSILDRMQRDARSHGLRPRPQFDGATYDERRDEARLSRQLDRVLECLKRGGWWTLRDLAREAGGSEAGCSARLRDLRKVRNGSHTIERRRVSNSGLWEYRIS
jgi:hypothetical protein